MAHEPSQPSSGDAEDLRRAAPAEGGATPSPIEDVRESDAVIDVNEPTPEDERVEELLDKPTIDLPEFADAV